jgi:hypothetical protein
VAIDMPEDRAVVGARGANAHDVLVLYQREPADPHYIVDPNLEWS